MSGGSSDSGVGERIEKTLKEGAKFHVVIPRDPTRGELVLRAISGTMRVFGKALLIVGIAIILSGTLRIVDWQMEVGDLIEQRDAAFERAIQAGTRESAAREEIQTVLEREQQALKLNQEVFALLDGATSDNKLLTTQAMSDTLELETAQVHNVNLEKQLAEALARQSKLEVLFDEASEKHDILSHEIDSTLTENAILIKHLANLEENLTKDSGKVITVTVPVGYVALDWVGTAYHAGPDVFSTTVPPLIVDQSPMVTVWLGSAVLSDTSKVDVILEIRFRRRGNDAGALIQLYKSGMYLENEIVEKYVRNFLWEAAQAVLGGYSASSYRAKTLDIKNEIFHAINGPLYGAGLELSSLIILKMEPAIN